MSLVGKGSLVNPAKDITYHGSGSLAQSNYPICSALLVGSEGFIMAVTKNGGTLTFYAPAGIIPLQVISIEMYATTATAADNISLLY